MNFLQKILECLFVWNLEETDLSGADVIIVHAGSDSADNSPGPINIHISEVVRSIHEKTGLPIVAQGEVAQCLTDLPMYGVIPKQSDSIHYLDSTDVAKIQKQVCDENSWNHPILVANGHHLWRVKMVTLKVGFADTRNPKIKSVYFWGCKHWWMKSPWLFIPREFICRVVWLLQGKI